MQEAYLGAYDSGFQGTQEEKIITHNQRAVRSILKGKNPKVQSFQNKSKTQGGSKTTKSCCIKFQCGQMGLELNYMAHMVRYTLECTS